MLKQWHSVLWSCMFFTIPMYFLGNILFITQLKLSLDSLLLSNQKNGALGYSSFEYGPYQYFIKITYFSLFFKFLSDKICLNQHRSHGFYSTLWNYYINTPYTHFVLLCQSKAQARKARQNWSNKAKIPILSV